MDYVGLVDCNNFFVSCERLFRPDLAGRPVVVLSSNDGCVVARSQEVKDKGIAMGVPYFQIKDILSDMQATVFSSHFTLYRDISSRVFNVLRKRLGTIEPYSIDECFFKANLNEATALGHELRDLVLRQVGIPVSVGIALSKTQAKFANGLAKRTNGSCVLRPEDWQEKISTIKLSEVWGVGEGKTKQFKTYGLFTVADFLRQSASLAGSRFGLEGARLYAELTGKGAVKLQNNNAPKTIMNTRSFAKETKNKVVVLGALLYHLHELVKELDQTTTKAIRIRVLMSPSSYGDFAFSGSSAEAILTTPSRDIFELTKVVTHLVAENFKENVPYKKAGIVASVVAETGLTASLFTEPTVTMDLTDTLLNLNKRFGKEALRLGNLITGASASLSRQQSLSPDYTTRWSDIKTVRA